MNAVTICRTCRAQNPAGSKFCNRCGAALPPATKLICPNCQTPNPATLFYCDNCGTRLLTDEQPAAASDPSAPAGRTGGERKPFSLPSRPPGQTANLEVDGEIPDWLKTGETDAAADVSYDEESVTLAQVSGSYSPADDLPDWLVGEGETDAVLGKAEKTTDELFEQRQAGADEEIPDWLRGTEWSPEAAAEMPAAEVEGAGETLAGWLDDLADLDEVTPAAAVEPPAGEEMPDWLAGATAEAAEPADVLPDWLREAAPAVEEAEASPAGEETPDWLAGATAEAAEPADVLPDWLREAAPAVEVAEEPPAMAEEPPPGEEIPDWLVEAVAERDAELADEVEVLPDWLQDYAAEVVDAAPAGVETPDWLEDETALAAWVDDSTFADMVAATDEPVADDLSKMAGTIERTGEDAAPDWLTVLDMPEPPVAAAQPAAPMTIDSAPEAEAGIPAWLMGAAETDAPAPAGEEPVDWLTALAEEPDELPSWLIGPDLDDEAPAGKDVPAPPPAPKAEPPAVVPDWLGDAAEPPPAAGMVEVGALPDWLADLEDEADQAELPQSLDDALPDWLANLSKPGTGPLPWREPVAEESSLTPAGVPADEPDSAADDFSSWLAGLGVASAVSSEEAAARLEPEEELPLPDNLPDWLQQPLGDLGEEGMPGLLAADMPEDEFLALDTFGGVMDAGVSQEDLPDWFDDVLQGQEDLPVGKTGPLPVTGELVGIPKQLAGDDLPGWLQDNPLEIAGLAGEPAPEEVPDWLQASGVEAFENVLALDDDEEMALASSGEWASLLEDLPEYAPTAAGLSQAEIPEWLETLRPRDVAEADAPELMAEAETAGPLAGVRGVVGIQKVIATPHVVDRPAGGFVVTPEQRQQVALLRQLTHEERKPPTSLTRPGMYNLAAPLQMLLAFLLLAVVLIGLLAPSFVETILPVAPGATQAREAINAAAGRPILVAFEYTPAFAGELSTQASFLLSEMANNGSPVMIVSQSAAGMTLGEQLAGQVEDLTSSSLGYLPGEAMGLRQLGGCLQSGAELCRNLYGQALAPEARQTLADVALVLVLTNERENLVNWLEQVGAGTDLPLVAGVTQSLAPVAAPYLASGQLAGLIDGLPAAAVYEQVAAADAGRLATEAGPATARLWAFTLAQWLVVGVLLISAVYWLVTGFVQPQGRKRP